MGVVGGVQRLLCGGAFVLDWIVGLWAAIILKFDLVFFLIDFINLVHYLFIFFPKFFYFSGTKYFISVHYSTAQPDTLLNKNLLLLLL